MDEADGGQAQGFLNGGVDPHLTHDKQFGSNVPSWIGKMVSKAASEIKATSSPKDAVPSKKKWFLVTNDCQTFVQDILEIAEDLAFQQRKELIISGR